MNAQANEPHLRVHCINIYVRDQDRSLRFYLDQLGFQLAFDARLQSGERWVAVTPPDGSAILSLVVPRPKSQHQKLIGRSTQVVLVTDDVAAKFREWSKRGVEFQLTPRLKRIKYDPKAKPPPAAGVALLGKQAPVWGSVFACFKDIDGNSFTLVSFDEIAHAVEAQRRSAAEKAEAGRRAAQELGIAWIFDLHRTWSPQAAERLPAFGSSGTWFEAWSWSHDGQRIAGHRLSTSGFSGVVIYDLRTHKYDQLTDFGNSPVWLKDNRHLLFYREDKLYLADSVSRKTQLLLSVAPYHITWTILIAPDDGTIYFSLVMDEADIWLARLE
jgi:catechol 2,3-dioxygenase-like lactoylglutathione lyase family enzyme